MSLDSIPVAMDAKIPPISTTKRTRYEMVPAIKGPGILMVETIFSFFEDKYCLAVWFSV